MLNFETHLRAEELATTDTTFTGHGSILGRVGFLFHPSFDRLNELNYRVLFV